MQQEAGVTLKEAVLFPPFHFWGGWQEFRDLSRERGWKDALQRGASVWGPNPGAPSVLSSQMVISILFFPGPPSPPAPPPGILLQVPDSFKEENRALRLKVSSPPTGRLTVKKLRNGRPRADAGSRRIQDWECRKGSTWIASL